MFAISELIGYQQVLNHVVLDAPAQGTINPQSAFRN